MNDIQSKIDTLLASGLNKAQVARALGVASDTVYRRTRAKVTNSFKEKCITLRGNGYTLREIALRLKCSEATVQKLLRYSYIKGQRLPRKEWKKVHFSQPYIKGSTMVLSFGSYVFENLSLNRKIGDTFEYTVSTRRPNKLIIELRKRKV